MKSELKIGLTGPTSTGKTTLARDYCALPRRDGADVEYRAVETRPVMHSMGYASHEALIRGGEEANYDLQWQLVQRRAALNAEPGSYITDRTPLDALIYYATSHPHEVAKIERMRTAVFAALRQYSLVVYVPLHSLQFTADSVRLDSDLYHSITGHVFEYYIRRYNAAYPDAPVATLYPAERPEDNARAPRARRLHDLVEARLSAPRG